MSTTKIFTDTEECIRVFKEGGMIIVMDDENRENEGDLIMGAQFANEKTVAFIIRHSTGILCTSMPKEWASHLALPPMVGCNTDLHSTAFTVTCDHVDAGTGVSAANRALTITALADPSTNSTHFRRPGHIFPLIAREGGVLERRGHTEASVDLCKLSGLRPVGLLSELCNDDGVMMRLDDCLKFSKTHNIPIMSIEELVRYRMQTEMPTITTSTDNATPTTTAQTQQPKKEEASTFPHRTVELVAQCEIPVQFEKNAFLGLWQLLVFVSHHDRCQHVVLSKGNLSQTEESNTDSVLTRIHSECFTGNTLGSIRCDCGPQLQQSMEIIHKNGRGVVIYVAGHEGRGIGLINKIRAYEVQTKDLLDTYQANIALGLPSDNRDYSSCLAILEALKIHRISLITSNPEKMHAFKHLISDVIPLFCEPNDHNHGYIKAKQSHNSVLFKKLNLSVNPSTAVDRVDGTPYTDDNNDVNTDTPSSASMQTTSEKIPHTTSYPSLPSTSFSPPQSTSYQPSLQKSEISVPVPSRACNFRLAIIHTSYNSSLVKPLVDGCVKTLCESGVMCHNLQVIDVPGSFELPLATQMVAQTRSVDAILCIGILIKGETMHFEYLSEAVVQGLMKVQLKTNIPVLNGVLNCLTLSQAEQRCIGPNNLSQCLALSLLHMATLKQNILTYPPTVTTTSHSSFMYNPLQTVRATVSQPCTDSRSLSNLINHEKQHLYTQLL